jgi:hypothetical protein
VVTDADDRVVAYVWRGEHLPFVRAHSRFNPDDLIVAEVVALDYRAADAALAVCRRWAAEEADRRGRDVKQVRVFTPHEGPVAAAAMQMRATFAKGYGSDGGWMARVLSARRLFSSLQPELSRRLTAANNRFRGALRIVTDGGETTLRIDGSTVRVEDESPNAAASVPMTSEGAVLICRVPQTVLVRLALGSFPPDDLLARLPDPPEERVSDLLQMMFPPVPALLYLADRF